MLKGSEHKITNILINLHGNVDLNIPNSLYTLNTFVKTQAIADSLTLLDQNLLHSLKRSVLDGGNLPLSEALLLEARIAEILNITKT